MRYRDHVSPAGMVSVYLYVDPPQSVQGRVGAISGRLKGLQDVFAVVVFLPLCGPQYHLREEMCMHSYNYM